MRERAYGIRKDAIGRQYMSTFQSIEEAREYFRQDLFATEAGMRLDSFTEDGAVCSVEITARHQNANGGIMGCAIAQFVGTGYKLFIEKDPL